MIENRSGHLVNGESDGEEVGSHLALFPSVLLHQRHHKGAGHLVVLRVIILLQQAKAVLRIGPESVCKRVGYCSLTLLSIISYSPFKKRTVRFFMHYILGMKSA